MPINPLNGKELLIRQHVVRHSKYLFIGQNKTATSSIHKLMKVNGLKAQHGGSWRLHDFDAFADNPGIKANNNFESICEHWAGSIFILNTRPLRAWLTSRMMHPVLRHSKGLFVREPGVKNIVDPEADPNLLIDKAMQLIISRNKWHTRILKYFQEDALRNRLILLDISRDGWMSFLADRLHLMKDNVVSKNITNADSIPGFRQKLDVCLDEVFQGQKFKKTLPVNCLAMMPSCRRLPLQGISIILVHSRCWISLAAKFLTQGTNLRNICIE